MRTRIAFVAALALSGCSLLTDTDWARTADGGPEVDMGMDDAGDLGPNDMDLAVPDMPITPREDCSDSDNEDEDGDGLANCADFDCLDHPGCCMDGENLVEVTDWRESLTLWSALPTESPPTILVDDAGRIERFASDRVGAARWSACVPLAIGAQIEADLYPALDRDAFPSCDGAGVCDEFVQLALSYAPDFGPQRELVDELSVRVYPGVLVEVRRANTRLVAWDLEPVGPSTALTVQMQLTPAALEDGSEVIRSQITVKYGVQQEVFQTDALRTEFLVTSGDCAAVPGLFVAFQGRGVDAGRVGHFGARTLTCPNPNQFIPRPGLQTLTRVELDWDPEFSAGGIHTPSIVSREVGGAVNWHVLAGASNEQLEIPQSGGFRLGEAIGHSAASNWNQTTWSASAAGPRYGDTPPSCSAPGTSCPDPAIGSVREPFLMDLQPRSNDSLLAFAGELEPFGEVYGIYIAIEPLAVSATPTPQLLWRPADVTEAECASLGDPAIVPTGGDAHWLFYTCQQFARPSTIRAVRFDLVSRRAEAISDHQVLPAAGSLGPFASRGVRGPEPMVDTLGDRTVIRLWFIGRDRDDVDAIGVAIAEPKDGDFTDDPLLPTFVPYPANPVIERDDRVIGCDARRCEIRGMAITDSPDEQPGLLRMLVARKVLPAGGGRFFDLYPVEQAWYPLTELTE